MPLNRRGPYKPQLGASIDWGHPLAVGLRGAWFCNEAGGVPTNVVTGRAGTFSGANGALSWSTGRDGAGLLSGLNGGSENHGLNTNEFAAMAGQFRTAGTIVTRVFLTDPFQFANRKYLAGSVDSSGWECSMQMYTNGNFFCGWVNVGGGVDYRAIIATSAANRPQNTWVTYATSWVQGVDTWFYKDGILLQTGTGSGNAATQTGSTTFSLALFSLNDNGTINYALSRDCSVPCLGDYGLVYDRALSATEMQWLAAAPYAMVMPAQRLARHFAPTGAGPSGFLPCWANASNQIVGAFN